MVMEIEKGIKAESYMQYQTYFFYEPKTIWKI